MTSWVNMFAVSKLLYIFMFWELMCVVKSLNRYYQQTLDHKIWYQQRSSSVRAILGSIWWSTIGYCIWAVLVILLVSCIMSYISYTTSILQIKWTFYFEWCCEINIEKYTFKKTIEKYTFKNNIFINFSKKEKKRKEWEWIYLTLFSQILDLMIIRSFLT